MSQRKRIGVVLGVLLVAGLAGSSGQKVAPRWGDAYDNLGVAQELSGKYDETEQAFNFNL